MADKEARFPKASVLQYVDGSQYVYLQSLDDLKNGMYVETTASGDLIKFRGEVKFPKGICIETVPKGWWTFVMVKEPMPPVKPAEIPAIEKTDATK